MRPCTLLAHAALQTVNCRGFFWARCLRFLPCIVHGHKFGNQHLFAWFAFEGTSWHCKYWGGHFDNWNVPGRVSSSDFLHILIMFDKGRWRRRVGGGHRCLGLESTGPGQRLNLYQYLYHSKSYIYIYYIILYYIILYYIILYYIILYYIILYYIILYYIILYYIILYYIILYYIILYYIIYVSIYLCIAV